MLGPGRCWLLVSPELLLSLSLYLLLSLSLSPPLSLSSHYRAHGSWLIECHPLKVMIYGGAIILVALTLHVFNCDRPNRPRQLHGPTRRLP